MKQFLPYLTLLALLALVPGTLAPDVLAQDEAAMIKPAPLFRMVIHETNPTTALTGKKASRIFRKKDRRWEQWEDGKKTIIPIDRERESEVRNAFSKAVHNKSASALESYWQRMIFSGRESPPQKLTSDEGVLNFIRNNPNAIGYVSASIELKDGVKELKISSN